MTVNRKHLKIGTVKAPGFTSYAKRISGRGDVAFPGYAWVVLDNGKPTGTQYETVEAAHKALEALRKG